MAVMDLIAPRFRAGLEAVKALRNHPRYQAAFIFGSVAEGTSTSQSDLDVRVVVDEDNPCDNINHPVFDDYKLDLSFRSFAQIESFTRDEIRKGDRQPNLLQGVIVFDKTGELTRLKEEIQSVRPPQYTEQDHQFVQFMLYHANNKVERFMEADPAAALYSMHANIGEVLKIHFKLQGHWWVSSKNVLRSLESWDPALGQLTKEFVSEPELRAKFGHWSAIIDYIARPLGGRQPIAENNCHCRVCRQDLDALGH